MRYRRALPGVYCEDNVPQLRAVDQRSQFATLRLPHSSLLITEEKSEKGESRLNDALPCQTNLISIYSVRFDTIIKSRSDIVDKVFWWIQSRCADGYSIELVSSTSS